MAQARLQQRLDHLRQPFDPLPIHPRVADAFRLGHQRAAPTMDAGTYLNERVDQQLSWLEDKSQSNKTAFMSYRFIGIFLGALITILSPYAGRDEPTLKKWIPPVLQLAGAGVALSGALLALQRHQENWFRYRTLKEAMEREKMLYLTGSTHAYAAPDGFHQFVRTMEDLMANEQLSWARQMNENEQKRPNRTEQA